MRRKSRGGLIGGIFGSIILAIAGVGLFFLSGHLSNKEASTRARCTETVTALVTSFDYSENKSSANDPNASTPKTPTTAITPVFEFEYNGQKYTAKSNTYSSSFGDKFMWGHNYPLQINPNNPQEIYSDIIAESNATMYKIMKWGGIALVILGFISFIVTIIKIVLIGGAIGFAVSQIMKKD